MDLFCDHCSSRKYFTHFLSLGCELYPVTLMGRQERILWARDQQRFFLGPFAVSENFPGSDPSSLANSRQLASQHWSTEKSVVRSLNRGPCTVPVSGQQSPEPWTQAHKQLLVSHTCPQSIRRGPFLVPGQSPP